MNEQTTGTNTNEEGTGGAIAHMIAKEVKEKFSPAIADVMAASYNLSIIGQSMIMSGAFSKATIDAFADAIDLLVINLPPEVLGRYDEATVYFKKRLEEELEKASNAKAKATVLHLVTGSETKH